MMSGMSMMGPFMWIFMLLFWGLIIGGVIFAVRRLTTRSGTKRDITSQETSLDVLKMRLARGEISEEEFARMKEELK